MTTASATAGLTRLNCLICRHHTPRRPEPSLVTCWPAAQCPAVQKEKAQESRDCLKREGNHDTSLENSSSGCLQPCPTSTQSLQGYVLGGALGEGLGEGTHVLTQLPPRGHQQHIQVCVELKQHQGLGSMRVGMGL